MGGRDLAIEYSTSLDLDLVYARWWGEIDLYQIRTNLVIYLADRNYRPGRPELLDLSGVTRVDLDFERIRVVLRDVNDQLPGAMVHTRTVLWAPDDDTYATGRMYQQLAEYSGGIKVEVYRKELKALAVFDLPFTCMADLSRNGGFLPADPG